MKKFILLGIIGFIGFINFGYCNYLNGTQPNRRNLSDGNCYSASAGGFTTEAGGLYIIYDTNDILIGEFNLGYKDYFFSNIPYKVCASGGTLGGRFYDLSSLFSSGNCPDCPVCEEQYTSLECQTEYGLIPINEVTENYCVTNGLCPSNVITGEDLTGVNWSSLYINDIQHVSAPLIDITIPEEFNWDYTGNDEVFELSVEGYNVDTEYISGIINTQNTKPTQSDLNDIINKVLPLFIPGLVIILFIYFVFRFIKKIF